MDRTRTVREALLADLLGEAMELIRRLEALPPLVEETRSTLLDAAQTLTSTVGSATASMETLAATNHRKLADFVIRSANEARRRVVEEQTRAMVDASRQVVAMEIGPALRGVADKIRGFGRQQNADCVLQAAIGAVAGIVASLCTTVLVLRFFLH